MEEKADEILNTETARWRRKIIGKEDRESIMMERWAVKKTGVLGQGG